MVVCWTVMKQKMKTSRTFFLTLKQISDSHTLRAKYLPKNSFIFPLVLLFYTILSIAVCVNWDHHNVPQQISLGLQINFEVWHLFLQYSWLCQYSPLGFTHARHLPIILWVKVLFIGYLHRAAGDLLFAEHFNFKFPLQTI